MRYNIYKLNPRFRSNKVYKGKKAPELLATLDTGDKTYLEYMDKCWYQEYCYKIPQELELDITYYVIDEKFEHFYTLTLHKGFTYWDVAEHDDRVIIAVEFNLTKKQAHII